MNEIPGNANQGNDGSHIIELLYRVDTLLRDELRNACDQNRPHQIQYLLEARVNINQAIEAIYDKTSRDYCQ